MSNLHYFVLIFNLTKVEKNYETTKCFKKYSLTLQHIKEIYK